MPTSPLAEREATKPMFRTVLVTVVLLPFAFGNAAAHGCSPEGEATLVSAGGVYVTAVRAVFQESNGRAGLQSSAGSCEDDNGRLISWVADARVA